MEYLEQKQRPGLRDSFLRFVLFRIKYFSPVWFSMTMGVAISGGILVNYPYPSYWLRDIGIIFWAAAVALFAIFLTMTILRHILFPSTFKPFVMHPIQAMFWGCLPIGLCSILSDTVAIFGERAIWPCYVLYWVDFAISLVCAWILVFISFQTHPKLMSTPGGISSVALLPVVTLVVNATTAAVLVEYLPLNWRGHMIIMSAVIWGHGELLAFIFIGVFIWRLICVGLPMREAAISCFLPIGPLGQGAYGFLINAMNLEDYLIEGSYPVFKNIPVFKYAGAGITIFIVGFATFWIFIAVAACIYFQPRIYSVAWWGLTFPMGTYALATRELGEVLDLEGFRVISCIVGTTVVLVTSVLIGVTFYFAIIKDTVFRDLQRDMQLQSPSESALSLDEMRAD
ncbi:voltage-dependent anion channel [Limtongia smithiae]|uniref:voltage-dependent anion channel n=1 Tax=Limtongia smithiae TaxID=1125753 RepID=UPI0034CE730E